MKPIVLLFMLALQVSAVMAQTPWPNFMGSLKPSISTNLTQAGVSPNLLAHSYPLSNDPLAAKWLGAWTGWGCRNFGCDAKVVITEMNLQGAKVVFGIVGYEQIPKVHEVQMLWQGMELVGEIDSKFSLALRLRSGGDMEFLAFERGGRSFVAGITSKEIPPYVVQQRMIPTPWTEAGEKVALEMLVFKPVGAGPFPTLVMNHGSTGQGDNKDLFKQTWSANLLTTYFLKKGWQVVHPQRRGRGQSGGLYDEGFDSRRSQYSCVLDESLNGLDRAIEDLDVVMNFLLEMDQVDPKQIYMGGQSRGGVLSVAYAARKPELFKGILNFVGGWMNDRCTDGKTINRTAFLFGATYGKPTLWLYGHDDALYTVRHMRDNFEAYVSQGGKGEFVELRVPGQMNGHGVIHYPEVWIPAVDGFIKQLN
jgi:dienelactone hydrolase